MTSAWSSVASWWSSGQQRNKIELENLRRRSSESVRISLDLRYSKHSSTIFKPTRRLKFDLTSLFLYSTRSLRCVSDANVGTYEKWAVHPQRKNVLQGVLCAAEFVSTHFYDILVCREWNFETDLRRSWEEFANLSSDYAVVGDWTYFVYSPSLARSCCRSPLHWFQTHYREGRRRRKKWLKNGFPHIFLIIFRCVWKYHLATS